MDNIPLQIKTELSNTIRTVLLTSLNDTEFNMLIDWYFDILNVIIITFSIKNINDFRKQLFDNNERDAIGIFLLLLPYIDDLTELSKITKLNEIYTMRYDANNNISMNDGEPKYLLSNIQYSRCQRNPVSEKPFSMDHLKHNYILLKLTIHTISHRLYVNWTNILPITFDTYKITSVYLDTVMAHKNMQLKEPDINLLQNSPSHLYIGTIYDTIRQYMYEQIVGIKWLLYDYDIKRNKLYEYESGKYVGIINIKTMVEVLFPTKIDETRIINLQLCFDEILWDNLDENDKKFFTDQWSKFIVIDNYKDIVNAIARVFSQYQQNKKPIDGYIPLRKINTIGEQLTQNELMNSLKSIPINELYEFIRTTIGKFKSTIYYQMIYGELSNKFNDTITLTENNSQIVIKLMPKNIYNYIKALCHYKIDDKLHLFPTRWVSMNDEMRKMFLDRLNNSVDKKSWFNISGNLRRLYGDSRKLIQDISTEIYDVCQKNLMDLVFSCLIISGTFSEFSFDMTQSPTNYLGGYYYLNGKKYYSFNMYDSDDTYVEPITNVIKYKRKTYCEYINSIKQRSKNSSWINMYAMNWVSQINFYHKYLNNRVIMVTGGTGVGKSTQIPKLLLYALKMVDYKSTGKIICSQPRKRPTVENANSIASQLGVTIKTGRGDKDYDYSNFNVQYRTHEEHFPITKKDLENANENFRDIDLPTHTQYPTLRIVTDKILLNSITNPLFKIKYDNTENTTYKMANMYDIVIVDESHEHNPNMDMILTLMKNVLYYNNDCKLVIISATMKSDEPEYRRYYRDINDNKMYPLNEFIREYTLDRINIDRRLHISVPRQTTRHKITETFLDHDIQIEDDDGRNMEIISIIKKILSRHDHGDILVFKRGRDEILKCVKLLNENTPTDIYAIPYYGEMTKDVRSFVEKVHKRIGELKISKDIDIGKIKSISDLTTGTATYKNVVIVATNIAEASITIDTLTDVIDDGLQKVKVYHPEWNGFQMNSQRITHSNYIQRKGRVGRVMDGMIHCLYTSHALDNIKSVYKICIDDITTVLFSLLKTMNDNKIFDIKNDPNLLNMTTNIYDRRNYNMGLDKIIKNQYFIGDMLYDYNGVDSHYDYTNNQYPKIMYLYGFDYNMLVDNDGIFYIVHPNEMEIKRNGIGKIINTMTVNRVVQHFEKLSDQLLVARHDDMYIKTDYGSFVENVYKNVFSLESNGIQYAISSTFGKIYGCFDELIKIITMIAFYQKQEPSFCSSLHRDDTSDLMTLLNIFNSLNDGQTTTTIGNDLITTINKKKIIDTHKETIKLFDDIVKKMNDDAHKNGKNDHQNFVDMIGQYIDVKILQTQTRPYSIDDMITLSLLHAFGYNIIRRLTGTRYYISVKYPLGDNIKMLKSQKTCVTEINMRQYVLYINMIIRDSKTISNSEIYLIHYIKPALMKYAAYQFNLNKYSQNVKSIRDDVDYRISNVYNDVKRDILNDVTLWCKDGVDSFHIFDNMIQNGSQILEDMRKKNMQNGGSHGGMNDTYDPTNYNTKHKISKKYHLIVDI